MTSETQDTAASFASLHRAGTPLVLYNIWDAGSVKAAAKGSAPALGTSSLGTSSWAVAAAQG